MSRRAAERVFTKSGLSPSDVQVVELHDCFSANELISYEALGLCQAGKIWHPVLLTTDFKSYVESMEPAELKTCMPIVLQAYLHVRRIWAP